MPATIETTADAKTYNRRDLQKVLGVSRATVDRLISERKIPGRLRFFDRAVRFSKKIVDGWIEAGGSKQ
jgi:excisionase family DNA binding protein